MNKQILVIEDEAALSDAISIELKKTRFDVTTAHNGAEGLKLALEQKPDVILLDLVMPVMDGLAMLKELRKDEWGKEAHVIVLTNLNDQSTINLTFERGVYDFLVKSDISLNDIVKLIQKKQTT
ncbi:response regulator [Candidatus Saccharibacteria bacterium]|nr:response regulator [Candidatus Saccharibacteria bacterium]